MEKGTTLYFSPSVCNKLEALIKKYPFENYPASSLRSGKLFNTKNYLIEIFKLAGINPIPKFTFPLHIRINEIHIWKNPHSL